MKDLKLDEHTGLVLEGEECGEYSPAVYSTI